MENEIKRPHCPECGLSVEQDELNTFNGYCEQCFEEIYGGED